MAFEQALAALQHLPDSRTTHEQGIDLRFDLRNALHPLNEDRRILHHLRQAEPLAEALGDQRRLGHLAGYLSVCLRHQGHNDEALVFAQRALAIGTAIGDVGLQAHCYLGLGTLYAKTVMRKQARVELVTAINLYHAMEMTLWLPQAEAALAQVEGDDGL